MLSVKSTFEKTTKVVNLIKSRFLTTMQGMMPHDEEDSEEYLALQLDLQMLGQAGPEELRGTIATAELMMRRATMKQYSDGKNNLQHG